MAALPTFYYLAFKSVSDDEGELTVAVVQADSPDDALRELPVGAVLKTCKQVPVELIRRYL